MAATDQPTDTPDDRTASGRPPRGAADGPRPVAAMSYEEARDELVQVVARLETGGETLEGSLALWERGEALAARCQEWLDGARERLDAAHRRETDASDDRGGLRGDGPSSQGSSGNEPGGDEPAGGRAGADRPGNDGRGGAAAASRADHDEENR